MLVSTAFEVACVLELVLFFRDKVQVLWDAMATDCDKPERMAMRRSKSPFFDNSYLILRDGC